MTRGEKRQGHSSPPANAVLVLEGSTSGLVLPSVLLSTSGYCPLPVSSQSLIHLSDH